MSKITVVPTQPTTERLTESMIVNRFLRETESGGYGTVTAIGANAASFYDTTSLKSGQYSEDELLKCWIRCDSSTDGGAPQGEIRPVSGYDPELGRVTVTPAFSVALGVGDTYQFFRWPHPQKLLDHITTILTQETWLPTLGICTEIPDGDMERSAESDWQDSGATTAKSSAEPIGNGRRYLIVTDGGGGGGYAAPAGAIYVEGGENYHLSAMVRCVGGAEARLLAYDVTNGAEIDSKSVSRNQWVRPYIDLAVPATCREISIRLVSVGAGDVTHWDDVVFFSPGEHSSALPSYIEGKDQIKKVFRLNPATVTVNDIWTADYDLRAENGWDLIEDSFTGHNRLRTRVTAMGMPLAFFGLRKEEAFSSPTTDYKAINANWMHAELCVKVFESLSSWPGAGSMDSKWIKDKLKDYQLMQNRERYKVALRMEKVFSAPPEMVFSR
jgi:hypothetical protein